MTTKDKALALLNEVRLERGFAPVVEIYGSVLLGEALCCSIEQHEAFRQEVSDKVAIVAKLHPTAACYVQDLIISAPKPDPLVEALNESGVILAGPVAKEIRAALDARGLEIREKNDD